jgi:hypothetical protein
MTTQSYRPTRVAVSLRNVTRKTWILILRKCKRVNAGYSTPCWVYTGTMDDWGYCYAKHEGKKRFVHRIAYAWRNGETPARRDVEHLCKQHACCNPDHLTTLPPKENAAGRSDEGEVPTQVNKHNVTDYVMRRSDEVPI